MELRELEMSIQWKKQGGETLVQAHDVECEIDYVQKVRATNYCGAKQQPWKRWFHMVTVTGRQNIPTYLYHTWLCSYLLVMVAGKVSTDSITVSHLQTCF